MNLTTKSILILILFLTSCTSVKNNKACYFKVLLKSDAGDKATVASIDLLQEFDSIYWQNNVEVHILRRIRNRFIKSSQFIGIKPFPLKTDSFSVFTLNYDKIKKILLGDTIYFLIRSLPKPFYTVDYLRFGDGDTILKVYNMSDLINEFDHTMYDEPTK